jgi:hypothetical protein
MSIVMDVRLFFTIAINVRWLHIVITKGDMAPPIRRKNRAPHILIIVVVVSLFLSSSSSWYPRRCILVISFYLVAYPRCPIRCCCIVSSLSSYQHRAPRGPSQRYRTSRHRAPQRSHPFAYGTCHTGRVCLQMGIGRVFSLG